MQATKGSLRGCSASVYKHLAAGPPRVRQTSAASSDDVTVIAQSDESSDWARYSSELRPQRSYNVEINRERAEERNTAALECLRHFQHVYPTSKSQVVEAFRHPVVHY